jgi:Flp pilus assembly protein TadG
MARAFSLRRNRAALHRLAQRFIGNRRGVAVVEFAMILPAMVTIYFGIVEVAQGIMIDRKVTQLTRALADLTAQAPSVTDGEVTNIFDAAQTIMLPFTDVAARMSIANVVVDNSGVARVCWSEQRNSTVPARGAAIDLPADLRIPNTSIVMTRASYDFKPLVGYIITGTIKIGDTPIYMRPRVGKIGGTGNVEQVERVGKALCPGFN